MTEASACLDHEGLDDLQCYEAYCPLCGGYDCHDDKCAEPEPLAEWIDFSAVLGEPLEHCYSCGKPGPTKGCSCRY